MNSLDNLLPFYDKEMYKNNTLIPTGGIIRHWLRSEQNVRNFPNGEVYG